MPRKRADISNLNDLIQQWTDGTALRILSDLAGVTRRTLYGRMREAGARMRPMRVDNLDALIRSYESGTSLKQISDETGVSRNVLEKRFTALGTVMRGQSESERMKWSRMTPVQRGRQTVAAHDAVRGVRQSRAFLIRRAQAMMRSLGRLGAFETSVADVLRERGYRVIQQFAIDRYNVDLVLPMHRVAVEIVNGTTGWGSPSARPNRLKYLLDHGWHVLILHVRKPLPAADQVVSFVNALRRDHPTSTQYRVIRCDGKLMTLSGLELYDRAPI